MTDDKKSLGQPLVSTLQQMRPLKVLWQDFHLCLIYISLEMHCVIIKYLVITLLSVFGMHPILNVDFEDCYLIFSVYPFNLKKKNL